MMTNTDNRNDHFQKLQYKIIKKIVTSKNATCNDNITITSKNYNIIFLFK